MSNQIIQSIIIPKKVMTRAKAIEWVKKHHHYYKIDETLNTYRFRQEDPNELRVKGFKRYRITKLPNGAELVIAYK